jgi:hypothetical protein
MHCSVPNVKQACCDIFSVGMNCQGDQHCAQAAMMALPPAELQWMSHMPGGSMNAACPGLQQLNNGPEQFCTAPSSESLAHGAQALVLAARPQPIMLDTGCDSEEACDAQVTCSFDMGPMHCSVPNVKQACCDIFSLGMHCQGDQHCAQAAMMALPPAELQWMSHMPGGSMDAACPGLQQLNNGPEQFCTAPSSEALMYGSLAIMTAQHLQPEKSGPLVPGMIGFAVGAAVVTSVVAMKKKRNSADVYTSLAEESA